MAVTYFVRMRALEGREAEVRDLLLSNVARIDAGERGSVVFAVHASNQDPREFWLYETWTDAEAVEEHESGPAFKAYKDELRTLVDPESLVFGDAGGPRLRGPRRGHAGKALRPRVGHQRRRAPRRHLRPRGGALHAAGVARPRPRRGEGLRRPVPHRQPRPARDAA